MNKRDHFMVCVRNCTSRRYFSSEMGFLGHKTFEQGTDVPSVETLILNLQKCKKLKNGSSSKAIYVMACSYGMDSHTSVGNHVVQMFVECECMHSAEQAMMKLSYRNEHSWTALICAYVDTGQVTQAFDLYRVMKLHGVDPSMYTFMALLRGCSRSRSVELGGKLHDEIMKFKTRDLYMDNTLIDMYVKCGSVLKAREVFEHLVARDVVSWTALISGYAEYGPGEEALRCFEQMQEEGVSPNDLTLVCVLKACGSIRAIDKGREISKEISVEKLRGNIVLGNTLVDMYAKCGALLEAQEAFDNLIVRNVVSWNVLIQGYAEHGFVWAAFKCFGQMHVEGICPDATSWTSLISGFAEHGPYHEALKLFEEMLVHRLFPDAVTFASVLKACSEVGAIEKGQELYVEMIYKGYDTDHFIVNSLIKMYAKSGLLLEAHEVFTMLSTRDIYAWNSIINAYAMNHEGKLAIQCFNEMQKQEVKPDKVTFTCILAACSHARMVTESWEYFKTMREKYNIRPNIGHYTSIIDLMARSGGVKEAEKLLLQNVPRPLYDEGMWASMLTACKMYGEVEVGYRCFDQLIHMNSEEANPICDIIGQDLCKCGHARGRE